MAYVGWQAQWWVAPQALLVIALVAFGGILPDIDADRSRSIRLIFNILSVPSLVLGVLLLQPWLTPGLLLVACGGIFFSALFSAVLFSRLTVHRGFGIHSWRQAVCVGYGCAKLSLACPACLAGVEPRGCSTVWVYYSLEFG